MKIYRIAKGKYIDDFSGEGARLYGGRWNKRGDGVLYFSEHLSLCVLELLVQTDFKNLASDFYFLEATLPDEGIDFSAKPDDLPINWRSNPPAYSTQDFGARWFQKMESLVLKVPAAVLPWEYNFLINPKHPSFSKIEFGAKEKLQLDARIFP